MFTLIKSSVYSIGKNQAIESKILGKLSLNISITSILTIFRELELTLMLQHSLLL